MTIVDIIILVVLIVFAFTGYKNGLVKEVFSLIAFFIGIYGALHFSDFVGEKLGELFDIDGDVLKIISYILVFIGLVILVNFLGKLLSNFVQSINLGFFDKIGGIVIGFAKGFLIIGGFIMLMEFANLDSITQSKAVQKSGLYKISKNTAAFVYNYRDEISHNLIQGIDKTDEFVRDLTR